MFHLKSILLAGAAVLSLTACAQQSGDKAQPAAEQAAVAGQPTAGVVTEINQDDFARLIVDWRNADKWNYLGARPAVVDFNATWCGPCRQLAPILKELASELAGKVDFYSIDVDKNKELSVAFGIQSIPMLLICPADGQPQALVGLHPKDDIRQAIDKVTGNQ
ncbi:MAG: thioredoxin fold domain-containing protein [Muribaculaceae bacterium]|nr:thioredoxin fold domain-containing protein [Muribaculaceae bacterium]